MQSPLLVEIAREKSDRMLAQAGVSPDPRPRRPAAGRSGLPALAAIADVASARRPSRRPLALRDFAYRP